MKLSSVPRALRVFFPLIFLSLLLSLPKGADAGTARKIDLTVGNNRFTIDREWTYNLGPTGMRGWIDNGWPETPAQDGYTAFAPFQILVTEVATNTPGAGVLAIDDLILGASTGTGAVPLFTSDARKSFGWAIGSAEATTGVLKIKRWRAGVTTDVSITLPVLGDYSATAPYNCPKTTLIRNNAAAALKAKIDASGWGDVNGGGGAINALALLATGNPSYLPMLQTFARSLAPQDLDLERTGGISAWNCYNSIFLAEYYSLTQDAAVFHGLSEYVIYAAKHSSMFGTSGHGFSNVAPPGGWQPGNAHGTISWYGPVNQAGLAAQLSIVLGKKAGVVHPEIDPAIERAAHFFGYYVNRGSIPYGEHQPYPGDHQLQGQSRTYYDHASNGKDPLAAVFFACIGNKPVETEYFSRMSVAGFRGEAYGHTGQGFSYLWSPLGANMGGQTAVTEYQKKMRWDRDMKRRVDGSFVYEGAEQWGPGKAANYADDSYTYYGFGNPTAYYLLHASIPLQNLYITGKNPNPAHTLSPEKVSNALWAGDFTAACSGYTKEQLVAALGEWDPIVRYNAATELATRTLTSAEVDSLIVMAENLTDSNQREAACTALGCLQAPSAVPALTRRLRDSEIWVRAKAAKALGQINATAVTPFIPEMLATFASNVTATYPYEAGFNWNDPLQISNGYLSETLFNNLKSSSLSADKSLLYSAIRVGIKQPAGMWRNQLSSVVQDSLTLVDVKALAPELLEAARTQGPCDRMFTMFATSAAMNGLAKYRIQEVLPVLADNVDYWGSMGESALLRLGDYGEAARWVLPKLYADLESWAHDNNYNTLVATIARLEAATTSPTLTNVFPKANSQILFTPVNTPLPLTLTGSRITGGNPPIYVILTQPAHGSLTGSLPNLTYTPATGYSGTDRFTFTLSDGFNTSPLATVNIVLGTSGTGLIGRYYDNLDFTSLRVTLTDPIVSFDWGSVAPNTLGAGTYSVRWTGQVIAPESGNYRFSTRTSDGARLWVNGTLVINDWNNQTTNIWNDTTSIALVAGQKYNLKMEYFDNTSPSTVRLYWYMPSRQDAMIIPQSILYPSSGVMLTSPLDGARFGLRSGQPTQITLTADASEISGTVANVSFYSGSTLIGTDTTAPYSVTWTNVPAGNYRITAKSTTTTGEVSTSAAAGITVDNYTVPVTTGLACHFDASFGVTVNGAGAVQIWSDRSGNAHHATVASGAPLLVGNQLMTMPVVRFTDNYSWFNVAGKFFTKEQYVVVRSPSATWSGPGSFLGRKSDDFLTVRSSSYNLTSGRDGFWQDHYPIAVSKNGVALAADPVDGNAFSLAPITQFMLLKITVDADATAANLLQYPYYQIGRNETLNSMMFDVAEIVGFTEALSPSDEALVGGYLAAKYGIATTYPAAGTLVNQPATNLAPTSATLNGTLLCNGGNYTVTAFWGPLDGGLTPANWANSATVATYYNLPSVNFSKAITNLPSDVPCYFTFRATSGTRTVWSPTTLTFTPVSAYLSWASSPTQGLTLGVNSAPGDDPDHDGLTNQQEFAFGLNPTNAASLNPITQPLDPLTQRFQYTRRVGSGLTYQILTSVELGTWALDAGATEEAVTTNGAIQTVTVHVSTPPLAGRLFVRVRAQ